MDHYQFYLSKSCITTISDCFVGLSLLAITTDSIIFFYFKLSGYVLDDLHYLMFCTENKTKQKI